MSSLSLIKICLLNLGIVLASRVSGGGGGGDLLCHPFRDRDLIAMTHLKLRPIFPRKGIATTYYCALYQISMIIIL